MNDATYIPIFDLECDLCGTAPCVGLVVDEGVRSTERCGRCYFSDRRMIDYFLWNDREESTE